MSLTLNIILSISLLILSIIMFFRDYKKRAWKSFVFHFVIIVMVFGYLFYFFNFLTVQDKIISKGSKSDEIILVIILYFFMVIGMLSSYAHNYFLVKKSERKKWDFGLFIAPIFASPIVFIPLVMTFQQLDTNSSRILIYLISFQNGFFWKEYCDSKRKVISKNET